MHPVLFEIFGFEIYSYGFMLVVGFVLAMYVASRRAKAVGIKPECITDLAIWAIVCGIIGARLFFIFEPKDKAGSEKFQDGWKIFNVFDGNLSWLGALAGAAAVVIALVLHRKFSRKKIRFRKESGGLRALPVVLTAVVFVLVVLTGARALELATGPHELIWSTMDVEDSDERVANPKGDLPAGPNEYKMVYLELRSGGLTFYGGFVPVALVLLLIAWHRKYNVWLVADVIAPSAMLGLAFGRIGCFLNGCCWGKVAHGGFWQSIAVRFPEMSAAFETHAKHDPHLYDTGFTPPVIPTQIISSFAAFGLFLFLSWFFWKRRRDGEVFVLMCGTYAAFRFMIEFVRADNPPEVWGMTFSQAVGVGVVIIAPTIFLLRRYSKKKPSSTTRVLRES